VFTTVSAPTIVDEIVAPVVVNGTPATLERIDNVGTPLKLMTDA